VDILSGTATVGILRRTQLHILTKGTVPHTRNTVVTFSIEGGTKGSVQGTLLNICFHENYDR
jgi:hypothetical protein